MRLKTLAVNKEIVSLQTGDFNGDGKPDIAVANLSGSSVSVLLGVGDGTFHDAVSYAVPGAPWSVAPTGDADARLSH